jgi:signal transduction histidine kinase
LTILRGELELALRSDKNIEQYQDILLSALEEVVRLTNVVETLLELSKAEAGQIKMNFEKTNLSRLILDIAEDAEILAESKDIKVKKNIQDDIYVYIDSARIHQAALNIVDNAVKYTPQGGEIKIELTNNLNYAHLTVSDTGVGIPEDELKHIFDRFYRVDKSRSGTTHGAGLGLSIVKWIVDAHNGQIEVESILNEGSTFIIKLPVTKNENNS